MTGSTSECRVRPPESRLHGSGLKDRLELPYRLGTSPQLEGLEAETGGGEGDEKTATGETDRDEEALRPPTPGRCGRGFGACGDGAKDVWPACLPRVAMEPVNKNSLP